jgi:hypothetical protein
MWISKERIFFNLKYMRKKNIFDELKIVTFVVLIVTMALIFTQFISQPSHLTEKSYLNLTNEEDTNLKEPENRFKLSKECTKFIIVTSINLPTSNIKYMNDAFYSWCLIVVGDEKTPKDWEYKNIYFLSLEDQLALANKFKIINLLPKNSYLRKILGYLVAIENQAENIYETDDDNLPFDGLFGFRYKNFKGNK